MDRIENAVDAFLQDYFGFNIPTVQLTDVVEIIIIAFFIYQVLIWIKNTRTWILFRGIMVIVAFLMLAAIFQMHTSLWLGDRLFSAGFIAIIILFQPELRKALEQLGRNKFFNALLSMNFSRNIGDRFTEKTITDMVKASFEMGAVKTGALIVIELNDELTEYERTGITLDSLVSRQLLINIFEKNTPLHDGAVLVRGNRIVSATCYLPLSDNMELSKDLGTRHRAAVGISEVCDALTIVVSEETGAVSIAREGKLMRDVTEDVLEDQLRSIQKAEDVKTDQEHGRFFWGRRSGHVDEDKESADR